MAAQLRLVGEPPVEVQKLKKLRQLSDAILSLKRKRTAKKFNNTLAVALQRLERDRAALRASIPPRAI